MHRTTHVAATAIDLAIAEGIFTAEDLRRAGEDVPSESTITNILRQLEADDWLQRTEDGSNLWRAGPRARIRGDMTERALEASERPAVEPGETRDSPDLDVFPDDL